MRFLNLVAGMVGIAIAVLLLATCASPSDLTSAQNRVLYCEDRCHDHGGLRYVDFGVPIEEICVCWEEEEGR